MHTLYLRAYLVGPQIPEVDAVSGNRDHHQAERGQPQQHSQAGLQGLDQRREEIGLQFKKQSQELHRYYYLTLNL